MKNFSLSLCSIAVIFALIVNGCALKTPTSDDSNPAGSGSDLVISEVFHISPDKYYAFSWIELYNPTNQILNWYKQDGSYKSWALASNGMASTDVKALIEFGPYLYAGTSGGISITDNNGRNWSQRNTGLTNSDVRSLFVSGPLIFAGTPGGVFRMSDSDTIWTATNSGLTNTDVRAFEAIGTRLFAGTAGGGMYRSLNNGTNWTEIDSGLTNLDIRSLTVLSNSIYAGTAGGVFSSADTGTTWTPRNTGLTDVDVRSLINYGGTLFAGTSSGVFYSTNNGTDWSSANTGLTNTDVRSFSFSNTRLFVGTAGGVFYSNDFGASWNPDNTELADKNITSLAVAGFRLFAGTPTGVYVTTTAGNNVITSTRLALRFLARMRFYNPGNPSYVTNEVSGEAYFSNYYDQFQNFTNVAPTYFSESDSVILPGQFIVIVNNEEAFTRHGELGPFNPVILEPTFPGQSLQGTTQPSIIQYMRNPLNPSDMREYYLGLPAYWDLLDVNEVSLLRIKDTLNVLSNTNRRGDQVIDAVRFGNYKPNPDPSPDNISLPHVPEWFSVARYGGYYNTGNSSDGFYISNKPIPGWYSQIRK